MINSFKLDRSSPSVKHEREIPFLRKKISFKPGVNIIFGPNGSGKSTLLNIIARQLFANQSGRSSVTQSAVMDLTIGNLGNSKVSPLANITHDGQPIVYIDARKEPGIDKYGMVDEFQLDGINSIFRRAQSSGQNSSSKLSQFIGIVMEGHHKDFPNDIEWHLHRHVNSTWQGFLKSVDAMLAPSIPVGQKTFLLDEPDSAFSMVWQSGFWGNVIASEKAKDYQIIIAAHSPFCLAIPGAHYIETEPGYINKCIQTLAVLDEDLKTLGKKHAKPNHRAAS